MWFNSFLFLAFFPTVLISYYVIPHWRAKKILLLAASYLFYACWNPPFVLLLFSTSFIDYHIGLYLGSAQQTKRRILLWTSLCMNLGVLAFFKYSKFLLTNFNALVAFGGSPGLRSQIPWIETLILP